MMNFVLARPYVDANLAEGPEPVESPAILDMGPLTAFGNVTDFVDSEKEQTESRTPHYGASSAFRAMI